MLIPDLGSIDGMAESIRHLLAANLTAARARLKLSQTQLADKADVAQGTISYWEDADSRVKSPRLEEIDRVAGALKIPLWELLMDEKSARQITIARKIWTTIGVEIGDEWDATKANGVPHAAEPPPPPYHSPAVKKPRKRPLP